MICLARARFSLKPGWGLIFKDSTSISRKQKVLLVLGKSCGNLIGHREQLLQDIDATVYEFKSKLQGGLESENADAFNSIHSLLWKQVFLGFNDIVMYQSFIFEMFYWVDVLFKWRSTAITDFTANLSFPSERELDSTKLVDAEDLQTQGPNTMLRVISPTPPRTPNTNQPLQIGPNGSPITPKIHSQANQWTILFNLFRFLYELESSSLKSTISLHFVLCSLSSIFCGIFPRND